MANTDDDDRLYALMQALVSRPEYASGAAPFPEPLAAADAAAIAADLQRAVDLAAEARARLAAAQGSPVACRAGCTACCEQLVMVWGAEVELVAAWLSEPEQAEARAAFLAAFPRWREATGDSIDRVQARTAARDGRGQLAELVAHWRRRVMCAFNRDGLCTIYEVRPVVCRNCHALDTADNCHPADKTGTAATSLRVEQIEAFLKKARGLSMAMHHALGGRRGTTVALCQAVYDKLTAPAAGR
jgi:hypothetical protein